MTSLDSLITGNDVLVADAGPLLALARIDCLALLGQLFGQALVTETVILECCAKPERQDAKAIQAALDRGDLRITASPQAIRHSLHGLDAGEQTALELALQCHAVVLMDEKKGRAMAKKHHLKVLGVLGLLLLAKQNRLIPAIRPLLSTLVASGYFLSNDMIAIVLGLANE